MLEKWTKMSRFTTFLWILVPKITIESKASYVYFPKKSLNLPVWFLTFLAMQKFPWDNLDDFQRLWEKKMYLIMAAKREKFHFHTHRHHLHVQLLNYDFPKSLSGLYRWLLMVYCSRSQCLNMEMLLGTLGVSLEDRQRFQRIGPPLFILQQNGLESKKSF